MYIHIYIYTHTHTGYIRIRAHVYGNIYAIMLTSICLSLYIYISLSIYLSIYLYSIINVWFTYCEWLAPRATVAPPPRTHIYIYIYIYIIINIIIIIIIIIIDGRTRYLPYSTPLRNRFGAVCWLFLQAEEGNLYFTELAERVEYGNYDTTRGFACEREPNPYPRRAADQRRRGR